MKPDASLQRSTGPSAQPQMVRLVERERPTLAFSLDGVETLAQEGDTILTAVLTVRRYLGQRDFGVGQRAGFCLMGACQECWVSVGDEPVRACSTLVAAGMQVTTVRHSTGG